MNILTGLLLEGFADSSFARLFTEMNGWTAAIFIIGMVLSAIEMFVPGFGACGIIGTVFVVAGIVLRMAFGGDLLMFLYMVLIALVLFILMFWVFSRLITKSRLSKSALFHTDATLPVGTTEGTKDFSTLVGREGRTETVLHPIGKISVDGETVDVVARDGYIDKDTTVAVIQVEGQRVVVVEKKEDNK